MCSLPSALKILTELYGRHSCIELEGREEGMARLDLMEREKKKRKPFKKDNLLFLIFSTSEIHMRVPFQIHGFLKNLFYSFYNLK